MNILHLIPYYAPAWAYGGAVRAATDLTRALAATGHNVFVLTTDTLSPTERIKRLHETVDEVHVTRVPNRSNALRGKLNLSTPIGIANAARSLIEYHSIDIIHCHEVRTVENLRVLSKSLGVPVVVSPHGTLPLETGRGGVKQAWDTLFGRRLFSRFDAVIALTESEVTDVRATWSRRGVPLRDDQIFIVPNGVNLQDFAALPLAKPFRARWNLGSSPVVLYLGRLQERKGVQFLIPAFARAITVRQSPEARLLIVGPDEGMLPALQAQVREHGIFDQVIFTGLLTGSDKLAALAAADIFALPAVGEGFSMAVLEAMACGLPVLLTPGCNFPEVVEVGAGLVVQREVEPLSAALQDLLTDADRRVTMGRRARAMVESRYTWPQVVAQLEDVYRAVIARKP